MEIKCNNCNCIFDSKDIKLSDNYLGAMYTETYYNCPKCNKKYLICIENAETRKTQIEINKYLKKGDKDNAQLLMYRRKYYLDKLNGKSC